MNANGPMLELRYLVETGPKGLPVAPSLREALAAFWAPAERREVRVRLERTRLSLEWGEQGRPAAFGYVEDLKTGEGLWIDHRARRFTRRAQRPPQRNDETRLTARASGTSHEGLSGHSVAIERFFLSGPPSMHVSTWRGSAASATARNRLWELLLPLAPDGLRAAGLPYAVLQACPEAHAERFVKVQLVDAQQLPPAEPASMEPPATYAETALHRVHRKLTQRERPASKHAAKGAANMRRKHRLRSGGQDVAWAVRQSLLDVVREGVNAVSSCFTTFLTRRNHLSIRWPDQIADRLDPDGAGTDKLLALQLLQLFWRVYDGRAILTSEQHDDGLTPDEVTAIEAAPPHSDCEDQGLNERECRVLTFHATLAPDPAGQARLNRLAAAQWNRLRLDIELPRRDLAQIADDCLRATISDPYVEIILNEQPLIHDLSFQGGDEIRLEVRVEEIYVSFDWSTDLLGACSALGFFLLGPFGFIDMPGWGQFVAEDARIVVDFEPREEGRTIRLVPILDRRESRFDGDLLLLSVNPINLVAGLVTSIFESWFQGLNDTLVEEFRDQLEDFLTFEEFIWARFWHANHGPGILPTVVLLNPDPAGGVFEAHLAQGRGLRPSVAEDIDWTEVGENGNGAFVLSDRYLSAWLRESTQLAAGSTRLPLSELYDATGVRLPRASSLGNAGDVPSEEQLVRPPFPGCDEQPPAPESQYFNRVQLFRGSPTVILPEAGSSPVAGRVTAAYGFLVEAVARDFPPELHLVREPCAQDPGAFFEGFGRFGGFDEPFIPPGWLRGEYAWLGGIDPAMQRASRFARTGAGPEPRGMAGEGGMDGGPSGSGWRAGGGGDVPCPPPMCHWTFPGKDRVLFTYVDALVRISADVVVGYSGKEFWLPELALAIPADAIAVEIEELVAEEPFTGEARAALEDYILARVRDDANAFLAPAIREPPALEQLPRFVINLLLANGIDPTVASDVANFMSLRQPGDEDTFAYNITENLVYWPHELRQTLSDYFSD